MRFFVTGTDTDVGKTVACAWLTLHMGARYWKPVQAGLDETDEATIRRLTGVGDDRIVPSAYALPEPLSPHESARRAGVTIDIDSLHAPPGDDPLIVEGAGGVLVPLNDEALVIDLIEQLRLPVILVCRTTLGTINHTLMSLKVLRARNLQVVGAILSGPDAPHNRQAIESYGRVRIIGHLPQLDPLTREALEGIAPEIDPATL